jgi:hypothetical protein
VSTPEGNLAVLEAANLTVPHNNADDSVLTRGVARFWKRVSEPFADNVYGPIAEWNHTAGAIALNGTLTAPRLLERPLGNLYLKSIESGNKGVAIGALAAKGFLKATDGLDGAVARATGTSTEFGTGFDPLVDILGTYDDTRVVKQLAKEEGDVLTVRLMNTRLAIDGLAILVGGIGNTIATKIAEKRGVELEEREQSKANAMAKAKYAIGAAGAITLETSYVFDESSAPKEAFKRTGQALTVAGIGVGVVSVYQYGKSAARKIRRAFAAKPAVE